MKYFMMICVVGLMMSSSMYGQTTSGLSYELVSTDNSPRLTSYNEKTYNFNGRDTKFKKNRRIINYTALGFVGLGTTIGLAMTMHCNATASGDNQCKVPVVVGAFFGACAGFLTLMAHPINRISNKGKEMSYIPMHPNDVDMYVELGVMNSGVGVALKF